MLHDDFQGHYMTVKLIDTIHRGVILLLTGPPPSTVMKCGSDECFHTFLNPGLFLGSTAIFNHAVSDRLWTTKTLFEDYEDRLKLEDISDPSRAATNNYFL